MNFFTRDELRCYAQANPIGYLVEGILKEGTFNICSGEAKSGKSTLIRYLASCVTNGTPFLDKETKAGRVLYVCPDETDTTELSLAFDILGAGDGLLINPNPVDKSKLHAELGEWFEKLSDVKLVVLDTLAKTLEYEDLNSYDKVVRDIGPIQELARETGVTIVAMHHTNKGTGNSIAAALMGSGGLASLAATVLEVSSNNGRRYLRSLQRNGVEIERAELHFDRETGRMSLGMSSSEKNQALTVMKSNELVSAIIQFVRSRGTVTRKELREGVKGHAQVRNRTADKLAEQGVLVRAGTGKNSDPLTYSIAELPNERAIQKAA